MLNPKNTIPAALIWAQCITFSALYAIWMLRDLMFFRRVALVAGALMAIYPIYQYRSYFFQKRAIPLWLLVGLFAWAIFHLLFLANDFPAQFLELRRIWKYAGLGAIFALGLGLSLASTSQRETYWPIVYFGFSLPVLIYLLKYLLMTYGVFIGISPPAFLQIVDSSSPHYHVPKTDYIAFCLPVLALSLGQILSLLTLKDRLTNRQYLAMSAYSFIVGGTLFLFYVQDTKNGIAYSLFSIALFLTIAIFKVPTGKFWHKLLLSMIALACVVAFLYAHLQKNDSWRTLIADTKVGLQLEQFSHWKYAGERGYPINEYGTIVSITNYERGAWFKAGLQLSAEYPLGYGLVEDSFMRMARARWPEASTKLSHSHSGWLDLILGVGFPGFFCILAALLISILKVRETLEPWRSVFLWGLLANLMLWVTTEVSATITFSALIFWISWACGLTLIQFNGAAKRD